MTRLSYLVSAVLLGLVAGQGTPGDICVWQQARAGVVRDSLYIEGGIYSIWEDGKCKTKIRPYGNLFQLNFSTPIDTKKGNFTNLFTSINETIDPSYVPHVNGFMVADNDEWYTIGGLTDPKVDNYTTNSGITRYAAYSPNAAATGAWRGVTPNVQVAKGNLTNKFISNGAGVSVPNEALGFYFSGMRSATNSAMSYMVFNQSDPHAPSSLVNSMLKVDTSIYSEPIWDEIPLPANVLPRAEAMLAWVPAGPKGALVVMGGVPYPADLYINGWCYLNTSMTTQNNNFGKNFMSNVTVYDVATGRWYTQVTQGNPPQLAQACTVVATSQDNKTHNIYVYGGYNGVDADETSDDVWVLSLPSFTWVKAAAGSPGHARYAHVCAKPYPDQMISVGGTRDCNAELKNTPIVDVFSLNDLTWTGTYNPEKGSDYVVPSKIADAIRATPTASMEAGLLSLFQTAYTGQLPHWYPYPRAANSGTSSSESSQPSWVVPVAVAVPIVTVVIGTVLACFFLPCCLWYRRRKGVSSRSSGGRVSTWLRGQSPPTKSERSEDDTTQVGSPHGMAEVFGDTYFKPATHTNISELNDNSNLNVPSTAATSGHTSPQNPNGPSSTGLRSELHADTPRFELPAEIPNAHLAGSNNYRTHPMYPPSLGDHVSSIGRSISSPSSDPTVSPQELAQNRHSNLPQIPNDMSLDPNNDSYSSTQTRVLNTALSTTSHDVSPDLSATKVSPDLPPTTPPTQAIRPGHQRNVSSLSSTPLDETLRPSTREEARRSNYISGLPDSPSDKTVTKTHTRTSTASHNHGHIDGMISPTSTTAQSPTDHENLDGIVSPASSNTSPIRPVSGGFPRVEVKRKEVKQWPRHGEPSAYKENEDTYGKERDTL